MYSLNQGKTFLHLTEDLNLLEFGSGNVCYSFFPVLGLLQCALIHR